MNYEKECQEFEEKDKYKKLWLFIFNSDIYTYVFLTVLTGVNIKEKENILIKYRICIKF